MSDRASLGALAVSAALAVVVHLVLAGPVLQFVGGAGRRPPADGAPRERVVRDRPERELDLGRPDARAASMAWISYDDHRRLMARQASTEQPAIQQEVDPVADAPLEPDPTPPMPEPAQQAAPPTEALARLDEPPLLMQREAEPPPLPTLDATGPLPRDRPDAEPVDEAREPDRLPPDAGDASEPAPPVAEADDARPTATPRAEADADPMRIDADELELQPGGVLVGPGIEIHTARAQVSIMAQRTAVPRDITVRLHFRPDGTVREPELLTSTGYADWDGAILTSLYRWRAEGERLEAADPHLTLEMDYRFTFHR